MLLTLEDLAAIMPNAGTNAIRFVGPLNVTMQLFDILEPRRVAAFLAQIAHESSELTQVTENLNYSVQGLRAVFKRHFALQELEKFAHHPIDIANRVYAFRNGNGSEATGDGWRYRGRGLLQVTGRANYAHCGEALGLDLIEYPDLLIEPAYAARAAGWFWSSRNINACADKEDIVGVTRIVNGGVNGLDHRKAWYARAKEVLCT